MGHLSAWVGAPRWKIGLDNLGTQQPCVFLYSALLPGITNVTDRAWHYGFYPWLVIALEQRHPDASDAQFRFALRKADCLATLISARHAIIVGDGDDRRHGHAFPGRLKLVEAARSLSAGGSLQLSEYAEASDDNPNRYFKAALGGLGQYYLGVLRDDLHILAGERQNGVKYVEETCKPLAAAFGGGLPEAAFLAAVEANDVSADTLDSLASFCPCALSGGQHECARQHLVDIILARVEPWGASGRPRRQSLALALDFLAKSGCAETQGEAKSFLSACYSRTLPGGQAWNLAGALATTRDLWATYARNEMLNLAWEAVFSATLDAVGRQRGIAGIREAATWCVAQPAFLKAVAELGPPGFAGAVAADGVGMPALADFRHPDHELVLWRAIAQGNGAAVLLPAMRMLIRLVARHGMSTRNYRPFQLAPADLLDYPLTLDTLARAAAGPWHGLGIAEWLAALIATALSVHQRVAIRKLGQSGDDTLMFRLGEDGLIVERGLEEIAETQPRLNQAFQLLRDLGLAVPAGKERLLQPTAAGNAILEECQHG